MSEFPKIAFIGAGSAVFTRNIVGDMLQCDALRRAHIALMDIDCNRLDYAESLANAIARTLGAKARITAHTCQREAVSDADFVIVAFQIGGYDPCTITDFEIPKKYGLRQTIADTLGIGGIMRALRTAPHLFALCADMEELCPKALLLQHVNPMAINMWAISERYPDIRSVGLCHSVQGTAALLADDIGIPLDRIRYRCAGINHMAFYLALEETMPDGSRRDLYPTLFEGYAAGRIPGTRDCYPRCPDLVRYEMMTRLGYFVTESSEHFSEYVPWFIKGGRQDLIKRYGIPLDEYCRRCEEQIELWDREAQEMLEAATLDVAPSDEYASAIVNAIWTGAPAVIHGNVPNRGLISSLPEGCIVEVPCLVDGNGIQPVHVGALPPQLAALMRTNVNVQELTVAAILQEQREHVYHAAMMDPHTAAELDLDQIWDLVDDLISAHVEWLPAWLTAQGPQRHCPAGRALGTDRPALRSGSAPVAA